MEAEVKVCEDNYEQLLEQWRPLLVSRCNQAVAIDGNLEFDDVMSDMQLILLKAIRSFNPAKRSKFKTYLITALNNQMKLYKDAKIKRTNFTNDGVFNVAYTKDGVPLYERKPVMALIPMKVLRATVSNAGSWRPLTDDEVLDYFMERDFEVDPERFIMSGEIGRDLNEDELHIAISLIYEQKQSTVKMKMGKEVYENAYASLKKKVGEYFEDLVVQ